MAPVSPRKRPRSLDWDDSEYSPGWPDVVVRSKARHRVVRSGKIPRWEHHRNSEVRFPRLFPGSLRSVPVVCGPFCPRIAAASNRISLLLLRLKLVLPERIELSTSPLPRECSTTELRQRTARRFGRQHDRGAIHEPSRLGKAGGLPVRRCAAPPTRRGRNRLAIPRITRPNTATPAVAVIRARDAKIHITEQVLLDSLAVLSLHRRVSERPDLTPRKRTERAAREARLAKALRDNLLRRKEQRRAQDRREVPQSRGSGREREPPA